MFYCDECRKEKNWSESLTMSIGRCEICGNMRSCWDVKSSNLPLSADERYGKGVKPGSKPLAQYLDEYIEAEWWKGNVDSHLYAHNSWRELLEQALDAYQNAENVRIKIEKY